MYRVLQKFQIGNKWCVSLHGDARLLKSGLRLEDDRGNVFVIESIGMVKYRDNSDIKNREKYLEVLLKGNVKNIGETLSIFKE